MKVLNFIHSSSLLFLLALTSCTSQKSNDLDLSKDILGKHIDSVVGSDIKIRKSNDGSYGIGNDAIETSIKEIMYFNGVSIYGYFDKDSSYGKNSVKFLFSKKDSIVGSYEVFTHQTEKSELLINQLDQFLGEPDFTGYLNAETRKKGDYNAKVWEYKSNNTSYLLKVSKQERGKECLLFIVDNNKEDLYNRALSVTGFSKWEDYIKYKKRFEKPNTYTYQDYLKED